MIIDVILDRKVDVDKNDDYYRPKDFYMKMMKYNGYYGQRISRAMDFGTEYDVKKELCRYILDNDYNIELCGFICSVDWICEE